MEQAFYRERLADHGLQVLVPPAADRADVHRVIYEELCAGMVRDESRERYREVIRDLVKAGAEGIVLGCTEIELLISASDSPVPVFPTTRIHVETAVDAALPPLTLDHALATEVVTAIRGGDVDALRRLLAEHPRLARAQVADPACEDTRSLLHIATDWPGHVPNVGDVVRVLAAAGADVDARGRGRIVETPLHWAASSDDVAAIDALLDAGADVDSPGAVISGGTPLEDAVAFGQWNAARRLVERGASVSFREAAALGLDERVADHPDATSDEISMAFWYACHGGRRTTAESLIDRGADLDWRAPWDGLTPLDAALRSEADALAGWLRARGARTAEELASRARR
jgi:ankyrin repeat protein